MMNDERLASLWLARLFGPASRTAVRLLRYFGSASAVYNADAEQIKTAFPSEDNRLWNVLSDHRTDADRAVLEWCDGKGVLVLVSTDARYPKSLLELQDYPLVLYVVGHLPDFRHTLSVAVVGTRTMTPYGRETAYRMGYGLALGGATVVSGLALGIDGMAMGGALEAGRPTIGLLGSGIDVAYPKEHATLMRRVAETGAVMTEYAPGTPPSRENFPKRNRIISGLSVGTLVVEADAKSGSLITARHALYQGRDLYAVPGRVNDPTSGGTNELIKNGAHAVSHAGEILSAYEFLYPEIVNLKAVKGNPLPPSPIDGVSKKLELGFRGQENAFYGGGLYGGEQKRQTDLSEPLPDDMPPLPRRKVSVKRPGPKPVAPNPDARPFAGDEMKPQPKPVKPPQETAPSPVRVDYDFLGVREKTVYEAMLPDVPMLADEILRGVDMEMSNVLSALTMLEIAGVVEAGAGGLYVRHSAELLLPESDTARAD